MRCCLFLDLEQSAAIVLYQLDDAVAFFCLRQAQLRAGSYDDIFLSADKHRAPIRAGHDQLAGSKRSAPDSSFDTPAFSQLNGACDLTYPPKRQGREHSLTEKKAEHGNNQHGDAHRVTVLWQPRMVTSGGSRRGCSNRKWLQRSDAPWPPQR
jgi:hypothetical protein